MTVVRGHGTRVEAIVLKQRLAANESGSLLLKRLQDAGEPFTVARAVKLLITKRVEENQESAAQITEVEKHKLLAILKDLDEERLTDWPRSKTDCLAMLKYCSDVDPNLPSRILQETSPSPQLETPEFLKTLRDRLKKTGKWLKTGERLEPPQHPIEFIREVYNRLDIDAHMKPCPPGGTKGCDFFVYSRRNVKTGGIQIAGRRTIERGRMALAQARAFAALFYREGQSAPRRVASMWGKIWPDKAKFHIWCGTLSGDEFLLHMEERPVSLIYRKSAPLVDHGVLKRLLWLTEELPVDAVKPPVSIPIQEIPEDEEFFQYTASDDGRASVEGNPNPYNV
eukprot:Gregarina_sp_Pseudo_9__1234@NODE_1815_length_1309_cov_53_708661_g1683_i0_p1_GENE_NODE_1815_length_1309_cov_53_708661_g1683_i0NODE_1815_length_1309_cov_53_708661_g1683_i0_p1_ORF_typecomplete_len339_score28_36N_Asn_amidohyd/PF14736_6/0_0023_NODE_1815_length_1309_cov_53_708661_g1683_i02041220